MASDVKIIISSDFRVNILSNGETTRPYSSHIGAFRLFDNFLWEIWIFFEIELSKA
jgi:hypothetical protein